MKKPGLLLAAIVMLSASTNLSAAIVSPVVTDSSLSTTVNFSLFESNVFGFKGDYPGSVTNMARSNTPVAGQQEESSIPVPAAAWLFISGLLGMIGVSRRRRKH